MNADFAAIAPWAGIIGKPSLYPPIHHAHALVDLRRGGATNHDVVMWDEETLRFVPRRLARGPQGYLGAIGFEGGQGSIGAQGPQGPQGATGPQGPQGASGPSGSAGPSRLARSHWPSRS